MDDKELIETLINTGANLPPSNPYLDDDSSFYPLYDDDVKDGGKKGKKAKDKNQSPSNSPSEIETTTSITPDPKEYIAELERLEDEEDENYTTSLFE